MEDFSNSVMIALLPIDTRWCKIDLPHLTLVYAGELKDLDATDYNNLAKDAASLALMNRPITLTATGVEIFGDVDKVDVLKFHMTPELDSMRHIVEAWDKSEYSFNPHATIGPIGSHAILPFIPTRVTFNRVYVGWGNTCLTFNMAV